MASSLLVFLVASVPAITNAQDWWTPQKGLTFQWQIQGTIDTDLPVDVFDVDLFDTPESTIEEIHGKGAKVICYFSAGTWENWREDAADFPVSVMGSGNGWPGERWLDVNDQVWQHKDSGVNVSAKEQKKFNRFLARKAHKFGLAIGLKNDVDQLAALHDNFDFAVNEECHEWKECEAYVSTFLAANKPVFNAEYHYSSLENGLPSFCKDMNEMGISSIFKDYELETPLCSCEDLKGETTISKDCESLL